MNLNPTDPCIHAGSREEHFQDTTRPCLRLFSTGQYLKIRQK